MFPNRNRDDEKRDRVTVTRDIVEVVAIVAAGIWAFYVFAYENSFKPAHAPPSINVSSSLEKLSQHDGLIAVRINTELKNSSSVPIRLLAIAVTAFGRDITLSPQRLPALRTSNEVELRTYYKRSAPVPLYSSAHLSKVVDPSAVYDSELGPGNDWNESEVIYVPLHKFDLLTLKVNVLYIRDGATGFKVRLTSTPETGPNFVFDKNDPRINQFDVDPLTSLDLNAKT